MRALQFLIGACLITATGCRLAFDEAARGAGLDASIDSSDDAPAAPAIRAVQSTPLLSTDAFTGSALVFPAATTSGNTIVAYQWTWSSQGTSLLAPTDSAGNTYAEARLGTMGGTSCAGGAGAVALHVASGITGSATHTVNLVRNPGDNTAQYTIVAVEYEGLSAQPVVGAVTTIANDVAPLTMATDAVTTTVAGSLLVSAATICGGYPDPVTWSATDLVLRGVEPRTNSLAPGAGGDRIASGPGAQTQTWTVDFTGGTVVPVIAVLAALR